MLFKYRENFKELLKRRFNRLIIPYIVFYLVDYVIWLILQFNRIKDGQLYYIIEPIVSGLLVIRSNFNGAIWFLPCLFILEIIFYFIIKVSKEKFIRVSIFVSISMVLGIIYSKYINIPLPFSMDIALNALFFYYLGYIVKVKNIKLNKGENKFSIVVIIILLISFSELNVFVDMFAGIYGNRILFLMNAIIGIIFMFNITRFIKKSSLLEFIGRNTLIILAIHQQFVIRPLSVFLKATNDTEIICFTIIYFMLSMLISYFFVFIINKYIPWILGSITNDKNKQLNLN